MDGVFSYLLALATKDEGIIAQLSGPWHNWLSCNAQGLQAQLARVVSAALALPKEHTGLKVRLLAAAFNEQCLLITQLGMAEACKAMPGLKAQMLDLIAEMQNDAELDLLVACSMAVQVAPSWAASWRFDTLAHCLALLTNWQDDIHPADVERGQLQQLMALPLAADPACHGSSSDSSIADLITSDAHRIFQHQRQNAYTTPKGWSYTLNAVLSRAGSVLYMAAMRPSLLQRSQQRQQAVQLWNLYKAPLIYGMQV